MPPNVTQSFKLQRLDVESCRVETRPVTRRETRPPSKNVLEIV